MKRIIFSLFVAFLAVISCTDPLTEGQGNTGKLEVTPAALEFSRTGGSELISLTTDAGSWSLKVDADWCVPARTSGKTSSTFKVEVKPNEGANRTATMLFSAPGCNDVKVSVVQRGTNSPMPAGMKYGANINEDNSVTLVFYEADNTGNKYYDFCYAIGDFNDWTVSDKYSMERDEDAKCWWITLTDLNPNTEYAYQYCLRKEGKNDVTVSDPYTEIVYDSGYDSRIPSTTYPGMKQISHKVDGLAAAFRIYKPLGYTWKVNDFKVEDKNDLVIYELHLRDFSATSDLNGALAELDYLETLGVSAIELMPIHEFEYNDSWGYNPTHFFALDKAYGTRDKYKEFIDACHQRGIAVFVDVVYNHATGLHPWARMYWGSSSVTSFNPWFNEYPAHPYNVNIDFNHTNPMVVSMVKESLANLLTEYKVDGFRFDLSKGFTQKKTDPDVAAWGRYDQTRIDILKGYADAIWAVNPNAVMILEHLSDWDEEKVLAEYGMQLWRNVNGEYRNAMLGSAGNFTNMYSTAPFGGFVGYMESHDEERICFDVIKEESAASVSWGICGTITDWASDIVMTEDKPFFVAKGVTFTATDMFKIRGNKSWDDAYNYGASTKGYKLPKNSGYTLTLGTSSQDMAVPAAGTYDIYFSPDAGKVWLMEPGKRPSDSEVPEIEHEDPLAAAMRRAGACAAFSLTVPGPKMIWQFGEIGYDISINVPDRTGRKPLKTDEYMAVPERKALYDTYAGLIRFRKENPRFFDKDASFTWTPSATIKTIKCTVDGKSFFVVGNFGKGTQTANITLPAAGTWTNWFDKTETFTGASQSIILKAGEFKLLVN